jgi:hypothetical protein
VFEIDSDVRPVRLFEGTVFVKSVWLWSVEFTPMGKNQAPLATFLVQGMAKDLETAGSESKQAAKSTIEKLKALGFDIHNPTW